MSMPPLSPHQMDAVTHGGPRPIEDVDLSHVVFTEREEWPWQRHVRAEDTDADLNSAAGYAEVCRLTGAEHDGTVRGWYAYHQHAGGSRGGWHATREAALAQIAEGVTFHLNYSREHVAKLAADPHYAAVVDGRILVPGKEPAPGSRSRDGLGFGGARFHVRWLDGSGDLISHNMWSGGSIVTELRDQCPDNAVIIPTEHCGDRRNFHDPHVYIGVPGGGFYLDGERQGAIPEPRELSCTGYSLANVNRFVIEHAHRDALKEDEAR